MILVGCGESRATPTASPVADTVPSSSPGLTATAEPTVAATPLPTPAATLDPEAVRKAAGAAYLAAVAPYNKAIKTLYRENRNKTSLKASRTYCTKLADSERTWLLALQKIVVPADTTADVKALIRLSAADEAHLRSCAKSRSFADWNTAWDRAEKAFSKAVEAANLVRLDLGLPPVPG